MLTSEKGDLSVVICQLDFLPMYRPRRTAPLNLDSSDATLANQAGLMAPRIQTSR